MFAVIFVKSQTLSWCQRVVRISRKEQITYSDWTQEYPDFFQDHQPVKGERSIPAQQQRIFKMI